MDLDNRSTMIRAAVDFSDEPETKEKWIQLLTGLINMCNIGLEGLSPDSSYYPDLHQLRTLCGSTRTDLVLGLPVSRILWEQVLDLRKEVEQAYSDVVSNIVVFSISAVKGGIYINIGSHRIRAPDNLRVNHPLLQMVLFAEHLGGYSFSCLKSMAPKSILGMTETSGSYAYSTEYIACWASANWKSGPPNAARNPPCGSKKTSSTVSVIPQSGDNVKSGPYDSPMTVAEGNCGVSNKSNLELGKPGNRPSFREESNNCQHHFRKIGFASEDDTFIHMIEGSHGTSADRSMLYVNILDSGSPHHCTGDRSQLSDYCEGVAPVPYLRGAGGTEMPVHGTGSIHNDSFQVKGVLYVPGLNNQSNVSKTIFSVDKLNKLGFSVLFNPDGTASVIDCKWTWNFKHEIVGKARMVHGQFMLDYLRIPPNRDPMPMLEGPGLLRELRNASLSVWSSITGHLSQRTTGTQRPPV